MFEYLMQFEGITLIKIDHQLRSPADTSKCIAISCLNPCTYINIVTNAVK